MKITIQNILDYLTENQINYNLLRKDNFEEYIVASLFYPIANGFYYYVGSQPFGIKIENSCFLVNSLGAVDSNNSFIVVDESIDVQRLYYQILHNFFKRKSSGKICSSSIIDPSINLGTNVQIDSFTVIGKAVIGNNCIIGSHCKIEDNTIIGDNTIIESGSIIGTQGVAWIWDENQTSKIVQPQLGGVEIGSNSFLGANTIIVRGSLNENTKIGNHVLMAPGARLGHGTIIGDFVHFANNVATGGNVKIGESSFVGSSVVFRPKIIIHENTIVGAGAVVVKNTTKEGITLMGSPAKEYPTKENPSGMPKPKK